jgi:predicted NUDIX family phosphoesterase
MAKEDKQIIVVKRNVLFDRGYFEGFSPNEQFDYESVILGNMKAMRRGDAEIDQNHKQPIGYMIIMNPSTKEVFAYQRSSKDEHYGEKRLQGKWSWGVGGHIEAFELGKENPIRESRLRELSEEIEIDGTILNVKPLGYINDDSNSVGRVHFGILYLIEIDGSAKQKDKEIAVSEMLSVNSLDEKCSSPNIEVESWSKIALEPLKNHILKI